MPPNNTNSQSESSVPNIPQNNSFDAKKIVPDNLPGAIEEGPATGNIAQINPVVQNPKPNSLESGPVSQGNMTDSQSSMTEEGVSPQKIVLTTKPEISTSPINSVPLVDGKVMEQKTNSFDASNYVNRPISVPQPNKNIPNLTEQAIPATADMSNISSRMVVSHSRMPKLFAGLVFLLVIAGGAFVGYAYYQKIGPFAPTPFTNDNIFSSIVSGAKKIKTSSYEWNIKISTENIDTGATTYMDSLPKDKEKELAYKRDQDTVRDLSTILSAVITYYFSKHQYPTSLSLLTLKNVSDTSKYHYTKDGTDNFKLTATFETIEAVNSLKNATKDPVQGKTITFSRTSQYYMSIPDYPMSPLVSTFSGIYSMASYIPSNFSLEGDLSGASKVNSNNDIDGQIHLLGTVNYGDTNMNLDGDFRKIGDNAYVRVSKIPFDYGNLGKIKGQWIVVSKDDASSIGSSYFGSASKIDNAKTAKERANQILDILVESADKYHVFTVSGAAKRENVGSSPAYKYTLVLNGSGLADFYKELIQRINKEVASTTDLAFSDTVYQSLKSDDMKYSIDYMNKNATFSLWADMEGRPIKFEYNMRIVPTSKTKSIDYQVRFIASITLSDINKDINIDVPKDAISYDDASILISGKAKDAYLFDKQVSNISSIRDALSTYKSLSGKYPQSLSDLTKTRGEVAKMSSYGSKDFLTQTKTSSSATDDYLSKMQIMKSIPTDVYTHTDYQYTNKDADYALMYKIVMPEYKPGTMPSRVYTTTYNNTYTQRKLELRAVDGINTADSNVVSEEAKAASKADSDGDGVPDALEKYLGTNSSKRDSDGDGYSDMDEILNGTDPMGPGRLTQ